MTQFETPNASHPEAANKILPLITNNDPTLQHGRRLMVGHPVIVIES